MRTKLRSKFTLLFMTFAVLLAIPAIALADALTVNDVSSGGDVTKVQGTSGQAGAVITATTVTDDANGCNATGSDNATLTLTSSDVSKVNFGGAASASKTTSGCGNTVNFNYQVPSNAPLGTATITATASGGKANSTYTPDSFTVTVIAPTPSDSTAPAITPHVDGTLGNNGWYVSDVAVTWDVEDSESSVSSSTGCTPSSVTSDTNGTTFTCTAVSAGGTSSESVTIKRDATGPNVTASPDSPPDHNGWYNQALTVGFSGQDATSGIAGCDPAANYSGPDNASASVSGSCTDNAGNSASGTFAFQYDATAPTINHSLSPAANGAGWNKTDVLVDYSCSDATSGVASCGPDETLSEGANQSSTGNATDDAGNTASDTVSNIDIDKTAPSVALNGGPADGQSYYFGSVPDAPTCSASDALSGLDGACSVSGYGTTVGTHTVKATAKDMAGNTNTASSTYTVLAWTTKGFYQPVDMGGVVNTVKGGSTVPLKFELFSGTTELTDTSAIKTLTATKTNCAPNATEDAIEVTATGGTSLRYDSTSGQFIYNWKTPTGAGCYTVTMTAQDGSPITAYFKSLK
jgi:hypothetical protein